MQFCTMHNIIYHVLITYACIHCFMYAYIIYRRLVSWTSTHVHICTAFQRVNVAVSIQTYTIYTPGTCINRSSSACLAFINTTHTHTYVTCTQDGVIVIAYSVLWALTAFLNLGFAAHFRIVVLGISVVSY